jgi:hypothetical protein
MYNILSQTVLSLMMIIICTYYLEEIKFLKFKIMYKVSFLQSFLYYLDEISPVYGDHLYK